MCQPKKELSKTKWDKKKREQGFEWITKWWQNNRQELAVETDFLLPNRIYWWLIEKGKIGA